MASTSRTGYRAWRNFVLSSAPLQHGIFHTHDFGACSHRQRRRRASEAAAGLLLNTFLGLNRHNFEVRGTPCDFVEVRNNISLQEQDDALSLDPGFFGSGSVIWKIPPTPEQFEQPNPTNNQLMGVGDFDGDGVPGR